MFVFSNVIKPQGLEPLQFPTKFRSHSFGFPPTSSAGVFRTLRYAKYLQEFGWEPLILTVDNDASRRDFDESLLEPLSPDLVVCRTGIRAHDETVKKWINLGEGKSALAALPPASDQTTRAANESRWVAWTRSLRDLVLYTPDERIGWRSPAVSAARAMIEKYAPSVVYSTGPPHSTHVIASSISRSVNLPLVADFRDPWARAPWQAARNPWGVKLHPYFERRLVRRASQVILNTSRLADDFEQTYPEYLDKLTVIPNGYDPDLLPMVSAHLRRPEERDRYTLCHPGMLYGRRDPRPLLEAVRRIARDGSRICLEQIGNHDPRFELDRWTRSTEMKDLLTVLPHIPHAKVLRRMANANCFVLLQPGTHLQVPGKLFEMLMFRKPILTLSEQGATTDIVENYALGDTVDPGDTRKIESALRRLLAEHRSTPSGHWQRALADFDGRHLTSQLATCLNRAAT